MALRRREKEREFQPVDSLSLSLYPALSRSPPTSLSLPLSSYLPLSRALSLSDYFEIWPDEVYKTKYKSSLFDLLRCGKERES